MLLQMERFSLSLAERFTPQTGREKFCNYKIAKINALRKGILGNYSEEEACLKLAKLRRT